MKRISALLLAATLLLCGCSTEPVQDPTAQSHPSATEVSEPAGYYNPDCALEETTAGAIRVYDLGRSGYYGMTPMGDDILLFSGSDCTTLTKVSGNNLYTAEAANLSCYIAPEQAAVRISDKGITYFDVQSRELVFLDTFLKEVSRVSLPQASIREPALSSDRKTLYYCTAESLRAIDLDTGLDKLLKEMDFSEAELLGLHCNNTVIECAVMGEDGMTDQIFLSAETGETLLESPEWISLTSHGDQWCAVTMDGTLQQTLVGVIGGEAQTLSPASLHCEVSPVPELNGVVTLVQSGAVTELSFYHLESGKRTAILELAGEPQFLHICGDAATGFIWLMLEDSETGNNVIYRWDPAQTASNEAASYLGPVYTREFPNAEGLAVCEATAGGISQNYGVQILVSEEAVSFQPENYTLISEYQVPVLEENLAALEAALENFGKDFLVTAAESSAEPLKICLVRTIEAPQGSVSGLQFWDDSGSACIALSAGALIGDNLHHELFHVIETRVMSTCSAYDNWNSLNPKGFQYDYDYITNLERTDTTYLSGAKQAFIDFYSMSYPKEDRARIFEYAMAEDAASFFESETMQAKLRQLCLGIREAFGLEESTETYPWEQYLTESLAYQEKE